MRGDESSGSSTAHHLVTILGLKAGVGAMVLAGGFRAVSDDDFARVVLAQQWAITPKLDPTGTSWLPFPFWLYGAVMTLLGTSLDVARSCAFTLGLVSAVLLYAAARVLVDDRREALIGAALASVLPWSAVLGVATVPELPTAALTVFGVATLARPCPRLRVIGGAALLVACLSRYEPWTVATAFCGYTVWDGLHSGPSPADRPRRRVGWVTAVALAALGPVAWMIHNAHAHGSAFHFAARVSAYARAVGGEPLNMLEGYPLSLIREEPELCILVGGLLIAAVLLGQKLPSSIRRVAIVLAATLAALSVAAPTGGVPTHHAGRALLTLWLVMAIYAGAAARRILRGPGFGAFAASSRWARGSRLAFATFAVVALMVGAIILRPWYARLDSFTSRRNETAIGEQIGAQLSPTARVLLEARDFRYFAVQAGSGRPNMFVIDRSVDPRGDIAPSSFQSQRALERRADQSGATHLVGHDTKATSRFGQPLAQSGRWGLWRR